MASLMKFRRVLTPFSSKNTGYLYNIVRSKIILTDHWKPGPYPKTEEQRRKAAEKYGLSPEEYEPYPNDGNGYGDYPKLPLIGAAARDPNYPWDIPAHRRNFNEPIHISDNLMGLDRADCGIEHPVPFRTQLSMFLGVVIFFAILFNLPYEYHHPIMEKQIPKKGVVHYTFEPAN
ncbi:NADH dehydrogenase [ubiquinone] 1 beta subcomplex subunit 8, mitochondrial [Venturia canescens]|uniref:NADH dehydrogenase [ubiquinone] 1 beta subcomplex subunit 8, mitochondrial n=1 Tax=Venturia canescens TaxID=32260 RepID=UPI001C9C87A1|nr:NADH dehydrogenase [ubiquinone] 1 beta subcomplex subunit 8, mitochondrial [Venturia canescens]